MSDFNIANSSYTNKDFRTIYPELLDLVKKLSNKWDPTISNESDPGVLLIKLNALIADKCNYNIDKNVLETMPLSVTQYGNARQLYESLGYNMSWYKSATLNIGLKYHEEDNNVAPSILDGLIDIPQFSMVSDASGEIIYTIVSNTITPIDMKLNVDGTVLNAVAIEGVVTDYSVNGKNTITLDNLDSNNRIYFSETNIAENGIFISNVLEVGYNFNEWSIVDNLEATALGNKVYKFGVLPNSDMCYIEFPQDIANLIGSGLVIKYILSNGLSGNISAQTLEKPYTTIYAKVVDSEGGTTDTDVSENVGSSLNGRDPETIEDAYKNYLKTIGVFNTLVTCKDYESAILNIKERVDTAYDHVVSNCIVSDRSNDINFGFDVQTLSDLGESVDRVVTSDDGINPNMTAYDITLYLLDPMSNIYTESTFNYSFRPDISLASEVITELEDYKSVEHDYIYDLDNKADNYIFVNQFDIDCKISTYNKLALSEANILIDNVKTAIYKAFNARQVKFGKAIDFDELYNTILGADVRIKNIILDEPEYTIYKVDSSNNYRALGKADKIDITAKSVLAGASQIFKFDDRFKYELNDRSVKVVDNIYKLTTEVECEVDVSNELDIVASDRAYYTLKNNEGIQLIAPNLVDVTEYSTGIDYTFTKDGITEDADGVVRSFRIKNELPYALAAGEVLKLEYVSNGANVVKTYTEGTIVYLTGFDKTSDGYANIVSGLTDNMSTSKTIVIKEVNSTKIYVGNSQEAHPDYSRYSNLFGYWITNKTSLNASGELCYDLDFEPIEPVSGNQNVDKTYTKVLQPGEYFIYTDDLNVNSLVILGSGTKIDFKPKANIINNNSIHIQVPKIDSTSVLNDGKTAIGSQGWYKFKVGDMLEITEMQIVNLGKESQICLVTTNESIGEEIVVNGKSKKFVKVGNDWLALDKIEQIIYKSSKTADPVIIIPPMLNNLGVDTNYLIRSTLNVHATPTEPQTLDKNQVITIKHVIDDGSFVEEKIEEGNSIMFSPAVILQGGEDIDMGVTYEDATVDYNSSAYIFKKDDTDVSEVERQDGFIVADNTTEFFSATLAKKFTVASIVTINGDIDVNYSSYESIKPTYGNNTVLDFNEHKALEFDDNGILVNIVMSENGEDKKYHTYLESEDYKYEGHGAKLNEIITRKYAIYISVDDNNDVIHAEKGDTIIVPKNLGLTVEQKNDEDDKFDERIITYGEFNTPYAEVYIEKDIGRIHSFNTKKVGQYNIIVQHSNSKVDDDVYIICTDKVTLQFGINNNSLFSNDLTAVEQFGYYIPVICSTGDDIVTLSYRDKAGINIFDDKTFKTQEESTIYYKIDLSEDAKAGLDGENVFVITDKLNEPGILRSKVLIGEVTKLVGWYLADGKEEDYANKLGYGITPNDILRRINDLNGASNNIFNFTYRVNSDDIISDPTEAESFFKGNHIYNRHVIAKYNTKSSIKMLKSSLQ